MLLCTSQGYMCRTTLQMTDRKVNATAVLSSRPADHADPNISVTSRCDCRQDRSLDGGGVTIDVVTVVGRRDEPLLTIAARQLAQAAGEAGCDLCAPSHVVCKPERPALLSFRRLPYSMPCSHGVNAEPMPVTPCVPRAIMSEQHCATMGTSYCEHHGGLEVDSNCMLWRCRPLLVCIGMKQHSDAGIRNVIQQMLEHPVW